MKKKIAWLFLVAIALITAPLSQSSTIPTPTWTIDGTTPPIEPPPWGVEVS